MNILREKIHDGRFLRLIETLLQAGYLEQWHYHATYSGSPQGSLLSPILANCYLDKVDKLFEAELIPAYTSGDQRGPNPAYSRLQSKAARRRKAGRWEEEQALRRQMQQLPSLDTTNPGFRRLRFVRYADDVRHFTQNEILLAEKRGLEEMTSGSPYQPEGESRRGKEHVRNAGVG